MTNEDMLELQNRRSMVLTAAREFVFSEQDDALLALRYRSLKYAVIDYLNTLHSIAKKLDDRPEF